MERQIITRAEAKGRVLMVGHNMRHWHAARQAKAFIAQGKLGQIISTEIHFSADTGMRLPVDSWRLKPDHCPMLPVMQLAIHGFDLVHFLVGYIVETTAYARSFLTNSEVVDSVTASFRLEDGSLGTMTSNYCTPELFFPTRRNFVRNSKFFTVPPRQMRNLL